MISVEEKLQIEQYLISKKLPLDILLGSKRSHDFTNRRIYNQ